MTIANIIIDNPKMYPTTAIKAVLRSSSRQEWPETDETLIRRWQVKWKEDGATYLQRVRDERAEVERRRQEQAARQVEQRTGVQIMAEMARQGQIPGLTIADSLRDFFAQYDPAIRPGKELRAFFEGHAMTNTGEFAAQLFAQGRLAGMPATQDALRSAMGVLGNPEMQETMRRANAIGRAMNSIGTPPIVPKLPKMP